MPNPAMDPIEEGRRNWIGHDSGPVDQVTAATALTRGQQIATTRIAAVLAEYDLTFAQLEVLVTLAGRKHPPGMTELGGILRLHATTAARTVARLERARYVERADDETDRRVSRVRVSERGLAVTRAALARLREVRFGVAGWDTADARRFSEVVAPVITPDSSTS